MYLKVHKLFLYMRKIFIASSNLSTVPHTHHPSQPHILGGHEKCCFFHNSLQPLPRLHRFKALNTMKVYSHSYWLVIFCTTNSSRVLVRERWQTFENSWKKTQYLMNTLYDISLFMPKYVNYIIRFV